MHAPRLLAKRVPPDLAAAGAYLTLAALFYAPILLGFWTFPANSQAGAFHPLVDTILRLTVSGFDPAWRLYLLQVETVLQAVLGGMLMGWFARDLTGDRGAGFLGGALFMLSGYLTGVLALQPSAAQTAIWLPLLLGMLGRGTHTPGRLRWWVGAGVAAAMAVAAGHGPTLVVMLCVVAGWMVTLTWQGQPRPGWRHVAGVGAATIIGAGLSAAAWLPSEVNAAADSFDWADDGYGVTAQDALWQVLLPGVLTPVSLLYVGIVAVGLVVVALLAGAAGRAGVQGSPAWTSREDGVGRLPWRVGVGYLAIVGGLSLLLLWLGPGWAALPWTFALCGLAAYGYRLVAHLHPVVRRRAALTFGALVVGVVYGFGALRQLVGASAVEHGAYLLIALVSLVLGMSVALMIWLPQPEGVQRGLPWTQRRKLLLGLAVLTLLWANFGANLERVPLAVRVATESGVQSSALPAAHWGLWFSVGTLVAVAVVTAYRRMRRRRS